MCIRDRFSSEQEAELQALQQASRVAQAEGMMQEVRGFGRYPMESRQDVGERQLADKLRKARKAKRFSPAQEAELQVLQQAARDARAEARIAQAEELMQQKLCDAWKAKKFSPEQEAELKALQQAEKDAKDAADIAEARDKPNPNEGFADEAHNKIDQDLMMLENGIRTRDLLRRLDKYKVLVFSPSAQHEEFAEEYAERVREALAMSAGKSRYVPGIEVDGSNLRSYSASPIITGPLVCQLCESDFLTEEDFARHKEHRHAGEAEYRKRVLYLMAEAGCRPITAQEKRIMVQNFAHFQQFCHPGSKGNRFSGGEAVPRCEAACAVCAQKDYLEHRHKLSLFGAVPEERVSEHCAGPASDQDDVPEGDANARPARSLVKHRGVHYLQSPELVQKLITVYGPSRQSLTE